MSLALAMEGQCRLQVDSSSQLSLQRLRGGWLPLKVSGVWQATAIPAAGPTLANTGLVAATKYYVYAFESAGTLTLEAVTTAHATDATTGIEIKSGDATRTLVGMIFTDAGSPGTFVDSTAKRWCLNWFNRRNLDLTGTFSANRTTASTTLAEINTEIRLNFLTWADEAVLLGISGSMSNDTGGNASGSGIGIDSTTVATQIGAFTSTNGGGRGPIANWVSKILSEGEHFATLLGLVSGGTCTWFTADSVAADGGAKTRMWGTVRG